MFNSARLKLTLWYLLIIMCISLSFSGVIYRLLTLEVDHLLERQNTRLLEMYNNPELFPSGMSRSRFAPPLIDPEMVDELKQRLLVNLAFVNALILFGAGGLGFMLAGKTLRPIKVMIDEQNRFIADASHELRTPITALKTSLEVSLRDRKLSLKEAKQLLAENLEDVDRLQNLSNALLELAQYEQRSNERSGETTQLQAAIKETMRTIKPLAQKKAIKIELSPLEVSLKIAEKELSDVITILFDNAIKYSPAESTVMLLAEKQEGHVIIKITDEGVGISQKDLPHIFGRFYQVSRSRSSQDQKGNGLGLAIAKKTIERNHGCIRVSSTLDVGTTFSIQLPTA